MCYPHLCSEQAAAQTHLQVAGDEAIAILSMMAHRHLFDRLLFLARQPCALTAQRSQFKGVEQSKENEEGLQHCGGRAVPIAQHALRCCRVPFGGMSAG